MDIDIIIIGVMLFVIISICLCFYFEKQKFIHIVNHPEIIQEMAKVPLLLKIRVWYQYGRYIGNYVTEAELEERESRKRVHFGWASDAMRYAYFKHNADPIILKKVQEYIESLTYTYRTIWIKILSSKNQIYKETDKEQLEQFVYTRLQHLNTEYNSVFYYKLTSSDYKNIITEARKKGLHLTKKEIDLFYEEFKFKGLIPSSDT